MLRIFVIPCDDPKQSNVERLKASLGDLADEVDVLDHRDLNKMDKGESKWYGYLFSNEWLDEGLLYALPYYLKEDKTDYFVLFKKVIEDVSGVTQPKAFQMPRIFRSYVNLESPGNLNPSSPESLRFIKILDGWILEPTRKIQ